MHPTYLLTIRQHSLLVRLYPRSLVPPKCPSHTFLNRNFHFAGLGQRKEHLIQDECFCEAGLWDAMSGQVKEAVGVGGVAHAGYDGLAHGGRCGGGE